MLLMRICSASDVAIIELTAICSCRATLERVVEELVVDLKQRRIPGAWPPEAGPNKYPYTNNSVDDFVDLASSCKTAFLSASQRQCILLGHHRCCQQLM